MKFKPLYLLLLVLPLAGCRHQPTVDPLLRSQVDRMNKEAFLNRYRDPSLCLRISDSALGFIADSLPEYNDGVLRALNNKAFAFFQTTRYPEALSLVDQIENLEGKAANKDIERLIARLLKARLLQRSGQIADSYRLLHDIGRSHTLDRSRDNLLYNYAQTEYYITQLVLNFHYRDGKEADVRTLLEEVERRRPKLQVDYAQDMALN